MTTKNQPLSALQASIGAQLIETNEIVKLCAFAAEARRILNDISVANEVDSQIGDLLDGAVTARNEWIEHDENLAVVLKIAARKIEALIDQVEQVGVDHAIQP